jgi:hypothetical protein
MPYLAKLCLARLRHSFVTLTKLRLPQLFLTPSVAGCNGITKPSATLRITTSIAELCKIAPATLGVTGAL